MAWSAFAFVSLANLYNGTKNYERWLFWQQRMGYYDQSCLVLIDLNSSNRWQNNQTLLRQPRGLSASCCQFLLLGELLHHVSRALGHKTTQKLLIPLCTIVCVHCLSSWVYCCYHKPTAIHVLSPKEAIYWPASNTKVISHFGLACLVQICTTLHNSKCSKTVPFHWVCKVGSTTL